MPALHIATFPYAPIALSMPALHIATFLNAPIALHAGSRPHCLMCHFTARTAGRFQGICCLKTPLPHHPLQDVPHCWPFTRACLHSTTRNLALHTIRLSHHPHLAYRTFRTLLNAPSAFLNVFRRPHCLNERLIVFCSVLLASFEGIPYLLLGLGDGQLHHWHLDAGTGDSLLCVHATFQANNVRRTLDYEFGDQLHQWHLDAATGDSLFCMHATFQAN